MMRLLVSRSPGRNRRSNRSKPRAARSPLGLGSSEGVEEEPERPLGLAPVLGREAEQDDLTLADFDPDDGPLALDLLGAEQPAALQRVALREAGEERDRRVRPSPVGSPRRRASGRTRPRPRPASRPSAIGRPISNFGDVAPEDRAGGVELGGLQVLQDVLDRQGRIPRSRTRSSLRGRPASRPPGRTSGSPRRPPGRARRHRPAPTRPADTPRGGASGRSRVGRSSRTGPRGSPRGSRRRGPWCRGSRAVPGRTGSTLRPCWAPRVDSGRLEARSVDDRPA